MKRGYFLVFFFLVLNLISQEKKIILGIPRVDGNKYNVEYRKYDRIVPFYQKNGIEPVLFNYIFLPRTNLDEESIYRELKKFHVIHLITTEEGVGVNFGEKEKEYAKKVGNALKRYVEEGGGLFLQILPVRYPNEKDEEYWNEVLKVFGIEILHEGVFDKTRQYLGKTLGPATFFYTQNIKEHKITKDVKCLYLPMRNYHPAPGVVALKYSNGWEIVVRGEKEAKSYKSGTEGNPNEINLNKEGTYISEPPIAGVREFGKGRIVSYPISHLFTGLNYLNPLWDNTVEERGDPISGRRSDSMKLQINSYKYLAENSLLDPNFGTYNFQPYKKVEFPKSVSWDKHKFGQPYIRPEDEWVNGTTKMTTGGVKGIVGAHTSYTDGKGTVFDYVEEARKNGLSFIVFTEPLELLTKEELEKLKEDCRKVNEKYNDFYACPGIEFTDELGIRWIMIGERIKFPEEKFKDGLGRIFVQWDGKRVNNYGQYCMYNGFPQTGVIDYKQLRDAGAFPENMWWFYLYIPYAYEKNVLIADNYNEFLHGLRDLRYCSLISFTRIKTPEEVKIAKDTMVTVFKDIPSVRASLNQRCAPYWVAYSGIQQVTNGPIIKQWEAINHQMENNFLYTKGAQRVRLKFEVFSENGIKEVLVHNADYGIVRRFIANGEKTYSREFEMVHDKQYYLTLEVIDNKNKKGFSHYILIYCYKQGLFRCGDNLNILGPLGVCWHPDRNQMFPIGKDFRNGVKYALRGWDTASSTLGIPTPQNMIEDWIRIKGIGEYPNRYKDKVFPGKIMDVKLASNNIQIVSMDIKTLVPAHDTEERTQPALASLPKHLGEMEFFEKYHVMTAPMDRADFFVIWNYRRAFEGIENYEGSFVLHEGIIKIKKDIELPPDFPIIPIIRLNHPVDFEKGIGDMLIIKEEEFTKIKRLNEMNKKEYVRGSIKEGGYISWQPTIIGYTAVFIPETEEKTKWGYIGSIPGYLWVGLKPETLKIKKDTILKYKFIYGVFADKKPGNEELENIVKRYNLDGGNDGYPIKMEKGKLIDATFFFTARAINNEALFNLGPTETSMIIDLPIKVEGIEDNGCAAVFTTVRPWFRFVPVYENTAYFQEPIEKGNKIWVGNIFVCEDKNLKVTVVVDGQDEGKEPFVEIHNPTEKDIETEIWSPENTPLFGGIRTNVKIPKGESKRYIISLKEKTLSELTQQTK